jgi:hypothetical protein
MRTAAQNFTELFSASPLEGNGVLPGCRDWAAGARQTSVRLGQLVGRSTP